MIIQLEEAKSKLLALESDVKELGDSLKIERLREQAKTLEAQTLAENFWNDQANSGKVLQELKRTKDKIEAYEKLCASVSDALVLAEMGIEENDESVCDEVLSEVKKIEAGEDYLNEDVIFHSRANMTETMPFFPSIPVRAAQRRRTGHSCSTECIRAMVRSTASMSSS